MNRTYARYRSEELQLFDLAAVLVAFLLVFLFGLLLERDGFCQMLGDEGQMLALLDRFKTQNAER